MRGSEEFVYYKAGVVDMVSDASDFQLAGAKFKRSKCVGILVSGFLQWRERKDWTAQTGSQEIKRRF